MHLQLPKPENGFPIPTDLLCVEVQAGVLALAVLPAEEVAVAGDDAALVAEEQHVLREVAAVRAEGDGDEGAAVHLQLEAAAVVGADLPDPADGGRPRAEGAHHAVGPHGPLDVVVAGQSTPGSPTALNLENFEFKLKNLIILTIGATQANLWW